MTGRDTQPARAGGELAIGGDPPIVRLGYGAMQIRGPAAWASNATTTTVSNHKTPQPPFTGREADDATA